MRIERIRNTTFFSFFRPIRCCTALSLDEIRTHLPRCHAQMPNSTMHLLQAFLSVGVLLRCRKDLSSGTLLAFLFFKRTILHIFCSVISTSVKSRNSWRSKKKKKWERWYIGQIGRIYKSNSNSEGAKGYIKENRWVETFVFLTFYRSEICGTMSNEQDEGKLWKILVGKIRGRLNY